MDKIDAKSISAWMDAYHKEQVENGKLAKRIEEMEACERYGDDWTREMMRVSKKDLVDFLRTAYKKARELAALDKEKQS